MRDVHHVRELILGLAILVPVGCQSSPAAEDPNPGTKGTSSQVTHHSEPGQTRCMTLDEVSQVQVRLYTQEHARWEQNKDQTNQPHDMRHSGPWAEPEQPEVPLTACPESLTTDISYSRCSTFSTTLTLGSSEGEGDAVSCCYVSLPLEPRRPCGRLFYVEEEATRAQTSANRSWMGADVERPRGVSQELAMEVAQAWLEDALEEHASVAAFSRATLELMALGAPSELLAEYQRASLDEIEHARLCFSLVGALLGREVSAGVLEVEGPRDDLDAIIADVFWGGCVGESVAALCAQRALAGCSWAPASQALEVISEDEAKHAALAWSTLSFLGEVMPERVRRVLGGVQAPGAVVETRGVGRGEWAALGRLTPEQDAQAERDAWAHLIAPMLDELLAG